MSLIQTTPSNTTKSLPLHFRSPQLTMAPTPQVQVAVVDPFQPKFNKNPPTFLQMSGIIFDNVAKTVTFALGVAGFVALIGRAVESVKLRESERRAKQRDEKLEAEAEEEEKKEEDRKAAREKKKKALATAKVKKVEGKVSKLRKRDIMWERRHHGQWE